MLPLDVGPTLRPPTRAEWKALGLMYLAAAVGVAFWIAVPGEAECQSLSVGAGEIRHGESGRQDAAGLELHIPASPVDLYVEAMGRHGDMDDGNSGLPWLTATAGHSLRVGPVHVGAYAGLYSTPMSGYGTWTPLAGPRLDIDVRPRWRLHLSHYWRERGLVRTRMTSWTPRTLVRLDWRAW